MSIQRQWVVQGFFDQSAEDRRQTTTQTIRDELSAALNLPTGRLRIATYPVGPAWRHTFWWREGAQDYAEAQFFARIAEDYPILSIGVSVEKGREDSDIEDQSQRMDRETWAWQRLIARRADVLESDVPRCAADLQRPVNVRLRTHYKDDLVPSECATFCFSDNRWFKRHHGTADVAEISAELGALDHKTDRWVDLYFAIDLDASTADGLSPAAVADLLLRFEPIRRRVRR
jgi:hypothetical protein